MTASARVAFTALLWVCAGWLLWQTLQLGGMARLAPIWVIVPTFGLLLLQLVLDLCPQRLSGLKRFMAASAGGGRLPEPLSDAGSVPADAAAQSPARHGHPPIAWLLALALMVQPLGVVVAVPLFLLSYLVGRSGEPLWRAVAVAAAVFALLRFGFPKILGIELAPGWLGL